MTDLQQRVIMVVEDNEDNRDLIIKVLSHRGYEVVGVSDGHEALSRLGEVVPDLILMDINMPDMDGYTLTAKIKSIPAYKDIPIIAVTANVMRGDREKSLKAGCDGYIQKPIDIDILTRQLERYLLRDTHG